MTQKIKIESSYFSLEEVIGFFETLDDMRRALSEGEIVAHGYKFTELDQYLVDIGELSNTEIIDGKEKDFRGHYEKIPKDKWKRFKIDTDNYACILKEVSRLKGDLGFEIYNDIQIHKDEFNKRLRGARLASIPEIPHGAIINAALMKRLSGGDTVTGRFLFCDEFDFVNKAVMFSPTNFIPVMDGMDEGLMRRVVIVKFDTKIDDKDKNIHLPSELEKEKSGILNLLLKHLKDYQLSGLVAPNTIEKDTEDFCNRSNLIKQYFDEHYEFSNDTSARHRASSLYVHYSNWAKMNGYSPLSVNSFSPLFETIKGVSKVETNKANFYCGFSTITTDSSLFEAL